MNKANQSKKQKKKYWIPLEVTDETIRDFGIDPTEVTWDMIGKRKCRILPVEVTEAVYKAFMNPVWTELKRESRDSRCFIRGKNKKLIRCPECRKCEECDIYNKISKDENRTASLSAMEEPESERTFEDDSIYLILLDECIEMLDEINPSYGSIFNLLYDGYTQKEIAEELGMKRRTVTDYIHEIRRILQPIAKDMFER